MEEWVLNTLYEEMISKPLWLHCAFGNINMDINIYDNYILHTRLITILVQDAIRKCPTEYIDEYRNNWKMRDVIDCIKVALKTTKKYIGTL
jgi:hypothetical protein